MHNSMTKTYNDLLEVKGRFQPHIKNQDLIYTYIAPKDQEEYGRFIDYVGRRPTISMSIHEILADQGKVQKVLQDLDMLNKSVLELYVALHDSNSPLIINGALAEYIQREQIEFEL